MALLRRELQTASRKARLASNEARRHTSHSNGEDKLLGGSLKHWERGERSSSRATLALFWAAAIVCMAATAPVRAAEPDGPAALVGPAEALRIAIVNRVADKSAKAGGEQKSLADYYSAPDAQVIWVDENGLNARAKAVMEEIGKADDYGLRASDYALPKVGGFDRNLPTPRPHSPTQRSSSTLPSCVMPAMPAAAVSIGRRSIPISTRPSSFPIQCR